MMPTVYQVFTKGDQLHRIGQYLAAMAGIAFCHGEPELGRYYLDGLRTIEHLNERALFEFSDLAQIAPMKKGTA